MECNIPYAISVGRFCGKSMLAMMVAILVESLKTFVVVDPFFNTSCFMCCFLYGYIWDSMERGKGLIGWHAMQVFAELPSLKFVKCASLIGHNNNQDMRTRQMQETISKFRDGRVCYNLGPLWLSCVHCFV